MPTDRSRLSKTSYGDSDDYHRDLHGGGLGYDDLARPRGGLGPYAQLITGVWGATKEEFLQSLIYEEGREQFRRPHVFVRKWKGRRRKSK